jgi:hypothetical protein
LTVGCALSPSKREMYGAFASRGKAGCSAETLSRTSCTARLMSASSENSTTVSLRPSRLFERIILTPAMPFRPSSIGPRQVGLDRRGRGTRIGDADEHQRRRDVGQPLDPQLAVREQPEHAQRGHDHGREDGGC